MRIFIFMVVIGCVIAGNVQAQNAPTNAPVVVELFSSQGCPACPPADAYMAQLAKAKDVIALSCHVDYFRERGPALGKYFCTKRQTVYMHRLGRKSLFTPQMMVNGHISEIGYETGKVAAAITKAKGEGVARIHILPQDEGVFHYALPERKLSAQADLWLAVYDRPHQVSGGRSVATYTNVISHIMPLGEWGGSALTRAVFPMVDSRHAGFAIIAQDQASGHVIAAGDVKF